MRVLAARFDDPRRAFAARDRLQHHLHLPPPAVAIAPLGTPGQPPVENEMVLAGRIPDEFAGEAVRLVVESGGEIVADVDERLTRPRVGPPRARHSSAGWGDLESWVSGRRS